MAVAKLFFWALLFVSATLAWLVVLEHGVARFGSGLWEELRSLARLLSGG